MSGSTDLRPAAGVLVQHLGAETVLLDAERGAYFSLNEVGTRIWQLLTEGVPEADLASRIVAEFEVDLETATVDVTSLLEELEKDGLLVRS